MAEIRFGLPSGKRRLSDLLDSQLRRTPFSGAILLQVIPADKACFRGVGCHNRIHRGTAMRDYRWVPAIVLLMISLRGHLSAQKSTPWRDPSPHTV
jgi:hypothetical protein